MTITIEQEDAVLTLSDEKLDDDGYVNIKIAWDGKEVDYDFRLSEVFPALISFDAKRSRRLSDEEHLS